MAVRTKTRRRLQIVAIAFVVIAVGLASAYVVRKKQIASKVLRDRDEGYAALQSGEYFTAMHKIGPYLNRNRDDAEAMLKYAQARRHVPEPNAKHVMEAISLYRRLLEVHPNHEEGRNHLLQLYVDYGFNTEILDMVQGRDDLDSRRAHIMALARLRRFNEAMPLALSYTKLEPTNLRQQALTLDLMYRAGKPRSDLIARAEQLRAEHPEDARFELLQAIAHAANEDRENTLLWTRKAAERGNDDPEFNSMLAAQLDSLGRFDEAAAVLERAAGRNDERALSTLIGRLWQSGRYEQVVARLKGLDANNPKSSAELLALKAIALLRLDQRSEVEAIVQSLSERKNDPAAAAWARVILAVFAEVKPQDSKIIQTCRDGLRDAGDNAYFRYFLGEAYVRVSENDAALREFTAAFALAPAWAAPPASASKVFVALNRPSEALETARAAHDRAPDDPEVLTALAIALSRNIPAADSPVIDEILQLVDRVQQIAPANTESRILKVWLLAQLNRSTDAVAALRAALDAQPPLPEQVLLQLAEISRRNSLGLEQMCLDAVKKQYGVTPHLALVQAVTARERGDDRAGLELLEKARLEAQDRESSEWQLVWARYLELIADPRAKEQWTALADKQPDDPKIQSLVLAAPSVANDRALLRRAIDRLSNIIGEGGINWRLAEAQWLISGSQSEQDLVKATVILNEVTRRAPEHVGARRLFAESLEGLGKTDDAIEQLSIAQNLEPQSSTTGLRLAKLLQDKGDFDRAKTILDVVERNLRSRPEATERTQGEWQALAALFTERGDIARATAILEAQTADGGEIGTMGMQLAQLKHRRDQLTEEDCRRLLEKPDAPAIAMVADFYASRGKVDEASKVLARLDELQLKPGVKELTRANFYREHGTDQQTVEQLVAATKAAPENVNTWKGLIIYHLLRNRPAEAIAVLRKAKQALPGESSFALLESNADWLAPALDTTSARTLAIAVLTSRHSSEEDAAALEALRIMASAQKSNERLGQVLTKLRTVADRAPRVPALQNVVAALHLAANQPQEAVTLASRTMRLFPNEPDSAKIVAEGLAASGKWSEVLTAALEWKKRLGGTATQADLLIANAHLSQRNPAEALATLQPHVPSALADPDGGANVLRAYAQANVILGNFAEVEQKIAPLLPSWVEMRQLWISLTMHPTMTAEKGAEWLNRVAAVLDPKNANEHVVFAHAWHTLAQRSKQPEHVSAATSALQDAAKVLAEAPQATADEWVAIAMLQEATGNAEAVASYHQALKLNPDHPIAQNNLAMCLLKQSQDLDEALAMATKAAAHNNHPLRANFLDTLAAVQVKSQQYDAAITALSEAIKIDPQNIQWQVNLARTQLEKGARDDAKATLEKIVQRNPSSLSPEVAQQIEALRADLR